MNGDSCWDQFCLTAPLKQLQPSCWRDSHDLPLDHVFLGEDNLKKRMMPTKSTQAAPAFSPASSCSWAFCRFLPALVRAWITFQGLAPTRKDLLEPPRKTCIIAYGNSWLQYTWMVGNDTLLCGAFTTQGVLNLQKRIIVEFWNK